MKLECCFIYVCYFFVTCGSEPSPCTTPNGEKASCVRLRSCPILKESYDSEDESLAKFAEASSCGNFMVCCGTVGNYTQNNISEEKELPKESKRDYALKNLLPSTTYCGMQHTDDYFYNETQASVDEFPWLVLVYYNDKALINKRSANPIYIPKCNAHAILSDLSGVFKPCIDGTTRRFFINETDYYHTVIAPPKVTYKCTGVLISNQYALTSSSCASRNALWVALGQYDENKNVSCIKTAVGVTDCTDPVVNVSVVEQIRSPNGKLLLLRLKKSVTYTDFIRPLCLPLEESIRPKIGDVIATSGWGYQLTGNHNTTVIKKRIQQTVTNAEECKEDGRSSDRMCARVQNGTNYVCKTDRGGPMMYRYKTRNWYVEGILNLDRCVNESVSGERLTPELVTWILENMNE